MPFTGVSTNELFTASKMAEDVSRLVRLLSPKATPFLDWLGGADGGPDRFATSTKHEWFDENALPNTIITSTAVNSTAGADISIAINGLGLALTIGTILRPTVGAIEYFQVKSIVGADSITLLRGYSGTAGAGSMAAGSTLVVQVPAGVEGADHSGADTRRLGTRVANTVGLFRAELAISGTSESVGVLGGGLGTRRQKALTAQLYALEGAVVRGVLNGANSLGSATATRTMKGLKEWITALNSTVTVASFTTDAHKYIGDAWGNAWDNGAEAGTETWGIVAGRDVYRILSDLNSTKVQDSNQSEEFKRVIRTYAGPFGSAELFLGRTLDADEMLLVPRERAVPVPLQGRSFQFIPMAKTGDNEKELLVGEYTVEVFHPLAMARIKVSG